MLKCNVQKVLLFLLPNDNVSILTFLFFFEYVAYPATEYKKVYAHKGLTKKLSTNNHLKKKKHLRATGGSKPLDGKCREMLIIYKASAITFENRMLVFYGYCETNFKGRYHNHKQNLKTRLKSQTAFLKLAKTLKNGGHSPSHSKQTYLLGTNTYNLCKAEKLTILQTDLARSLTKNSNSLLNIIKTNSN